jgi:hypothetical protein
MRLALLALVLGLCSSLPAFEGVVDYKISDEGQSFPVSYSIKGEKTRVDLESQGEKISMLLGQGPAVTLIHSQKAFMKMDAKGAAKAAKAAKAGKFAKTGKTEKIAGYLAEEWLYQDKDSAYEVWATDKLGAFMGAPKGEGGAEEAWEKAVLGKGLFPLKVANRREGRLFEMLATKVAPKSLKDSIFSVPAGYSELSMGGMSGNDGQDGAAAPRQGQGGTQPDMQELMKKMMNASPEEQERMARELQKQYGQD